MYVGKILRLGRERVEEGEDKGNREGEKLCHCRIWGGELVYLRKAVQ